MTDPKTEQQPDEPMPAWSLGFILSSTIMILLGVGISAWVFSIPPTSSVWGCTAGMILAATLKLRKAK